MSRLACFMDLRLCSEKYCVQRIFKTDEVAVLSDTGYKPVTWRMSPIPEFRLRQIDEL